MKRYYPAVTAALLLLCPVAFANPRGGAADRIQRYRTREVRVVVRDQSGQPAPGVAVTAAMLRHQFLFGCNFYMFKKLGPELDTVYEDRWTTLFNYATVPFYLAQYQHSSDPADSDKTRLKDMAAFLAAQGVTVKGHPLIWHFPGSSPDWLPDNPEEAGRAVSARIADVVAGFPEIAYWDVLNEPTTIWLYDTKMGQWEQSLGPVATARLGLDRARAANPDAKLLINDYNVKFDLWSFLPLFSPGKLLKLPFDRMKQYPYSYQHYLDDLLADGARFDAVGLQSHMHMDNWPPATVWRTLERYASLGLPLHFTELTVISGAHKIMQPHKPELNLPWPSTEKGERKQAQYVSDFYTLLFSHPSVQAITWWDLTDRDAWMGAPAGLLRDDLSEKPAYQALKQLIKHDWWTNASGHTDPSGAFTFRAFCGDYQLTAEGRTIAFSVDCGQLEGRNVELLLAR